MYQAAPALAKELSKWYEDLKEKSVVVVIMPLAAIIDTQVKSLNQCGIPSVNLAKELDEGDMKRISNGEYQVVFGTPESWVGSDKWKNMLKTDVYQTKTICLVADEAHCVPKW